MAEVIHGRFPEDSEVWNEVGGTDKHVKWARVFDIAETWLEKIRPV